MAKFHFYVLNLFCFMGLYMLSGIEQSSVVFASAAAPAEYDGNYMAEEGDLGEMEEVQTQNPITTSAISRPTVMAAGALAGAALVSATVFGLTKILKSIDDKIIGLKSQTLLDAVKLEGIYVKAPSKGFCPLGEAFIKAAGDKVTDLEKHVSDFEAAALKKSDDDKAKDMKLMKGKRDVVARAKFMQLTMKGNMLALYRAHKAIDGYAGFVKSDQLKDIAKFAKELYHDKTDFKMPTIDLKAIEAGKPEDEHKVEHLKLHLKNVVSDMIALRKAQDSYMESLIKLCDDNSK